MTDRELIVDSFAARAVRHDGGRRTRPIHECGRMKRTPLTTLFSEAAP